MRMSPASEAYPAKAEKLLLINLADLEQLQSRNPTMPVPGKKQARRRHLAMLASLLEKILES